MLDENRDGMTPTAMITAIRNLPNQPLPSQAMTDGPLAGLLDGLDYVTRRVETLLPSRAEQAAE
jgi:hypothetical protein